jgi:molecular chaperone DnaK (HSP70)
MRVGIDLGTTYSLIARMAGNGKPILMPDHSEQDVFHTPSVVHITSNSAVVGRTVEALLEQNPELKVIRFFKRNFGENQPIFYDEQGTPWYPEAVAALVLKKLRFDAESYSATELQNAVITVPAHFNDPQRKAVIAAANLADIPLLGLVEEPVAAALHYGIVTASQDQILVVYDFGGGTFDVTALSMNANGVYVLAKAGITDLGGKELDEKVGTLILNQFHRALGAPLSLNARTLLELRRISEETKIELCMPQATRVRKTVLLGGEAVEISISRAEFEKAIGEFLDRTESETISCLKEAGLSISDVHALLLVGGSSMVPAVSQRMKNIFSIPGQKVLYHEPSKAVAFGAAIHSAQLSGDAEQYQLPPEFRGVTGYSVGVRTISSETGRISIDTLIKKNMPLPASARKTYYTTRPNQERIVLEIVQFRDLKEQVVSLGQLVVGPLPTPRSNYPIEVVVENGEDGTVAVQACDPQTGVELSQVFGRDRKDQFGYLAAQRALVRSTLINNL